MSAFLRTGILPGLVLAAACGRETPTDVGGPLLPGDAVRTVEVILDASTWLERDTAFSNFDRPFGANFRLLARAYQGVLDASTLARFQIPTIISAPDTLGVVRTDSTPTIVGGRVVLVVDTTKVDGSPPFTVRLYRITQDWQPATANWTLRIDSAGAKLPWAQPGAQGGPLVAEAAWPQKVDSLGVPADSLVIPVDSLTMALWADTTSLARGAVISMVTSGSRLSTGDLVLRVDARPSFHKDTVVTTTVRPPDPTFIFTPQLAASGSTPLAGGRPAWRTFFLFRSGLDTLSVACPQVSVDCRARLGDVNITYSALLLQPTMPPAGFLPQDSMQLVAQTVLSNSLTPLERSPLGTTVGGTRSFIQPGRFAPPAGGAAIELPVSDFLRTLVADSAATSSTPPTRWLALLPAIEGSDFGMAAFGAAPRLRLVLTIANELQLR